eukprot:1161371-Pelagomonas_calceolata.AAC.1
MSRANQLRQSIEAALSSNPIRIGAGLEPAGVHSSTCDPDGQFLPEIVKQEVEKEGEGMRPQQEACVEQEHREVKQRQGEEAIPDSVEGVQTRCPSLDVVNHNHLRIDDLRPVTRVLKLRFCTRMLGGNFRKAVPHQLQEPAGDSQDTWMLVWIHMYKRCHSPVHAPRPVAQQLHSEPAGLKCSPLSSQDAGLHSSCKHLPAAQACSPCPSRAAALFQVTRGSCPVPEGVHEQSEGSMQTKWVRVTVPANNVAWGNRRPVPLVPFVKYI